MSAISAVFYRESKIRMTNLTFVFWDLFFPLMQLLLFGVGMSALMGSAGGLFGSNYSAFFLAGVLAMANFSIAGNSSWSFFTDRDNGIFYEMLTYPMSRSQFLAGKLLLNVVLSWVQAAITVALACWLLGNTHSDCAPAVAHIWCGIGRSGLVFLLHDFCAAHSPQRSIQQRNHVALLFGPVHQLDVLSA